MGVVRKINLLSVYQDAPNIRSTLPLAWGDIDVLWGEFHATAVLIPDQITHTFDEREQLRKRRVEISIPFRSHEHKRIAEVALTKNCLCVIALSCGPVRAEKNATFCKTSVDMIESKGRRGIVDGFSPSSPQHLIVQSQKSFC